MHKSPKLPWKHATLQNLFCYSQQQIQYQQWVKTGVRWMSEQKKWKGWELSKLRQNQHSQQRIFLLSSNSQHNHWKQKLLSGNWALRTKDSSTTNRRKPGVSKRVPKRGEMVLCLWTPGEYPDQNQIAEVLGVPSNEYTWGRLKRAQEAKKD